METVEPPTANFAGRPLGVWLVLASKLCVFMLHVSVLLDPTVSAHGYSLRSLPFDLLKVADLAGAIALFRLRRIAPVILAVVLASTLLAKAIGGSLLPPSGSALFRLMWFLYDLAGYGVSAVIVVYAWHLRKQDVLH